MWFLITQQACLHVDGREQQEEKLQGVLSLWLRTDPLSHVPLPLVKANHRLILGEGDRLSLLMGEIIKYCGHFYHLL